MLSAAPHAEPYLSGAPHAPSQPPRSAPVVVQGAPSAVGRTYPAGPCICGDCVPCEFARRREQTARFRRERAVFERAQARMAMAARAVA